jgi:hypothetical protein
MTNIDQILRGILRDPDLMKKYNLTEKKIEKLVCAAPYHGNKLHEVVATIIQENANHRSSTQIYKTIKNIHHK